MSKLYYSDYTYVYFQESLSSDETVQAKHAFEGVNIRHYHADNGRFADNAFLADIKGERQTISYCGANAHFQNGRAEKRIRDLMDQARTQLIHARHRWPNAIEVNLWPNAMRYAMQIMNVTTKMTQQSTPIELF